MDSVIQPLNNQGREDEAEVGSDSSKLISDDSGSDDEDIDIENQSTNQIWNTFKKSPCSVDVIIFKKV